MILHSISCMLFSLIYFSQLSGLYNLHNIIFFWKQNCNKLQNNKTDKYFQLTWLLNFIFKWQRCKYTVRLTTCLLNMRLTNRLFKPTKVQKSTRLRLTMLSLLYKCETWSIKRQIDISSTSSEMKFIGRRITKYIWQDFKPNNEILSEPKIHLVQKEMNGEWVKGGKM